MHVPRSLWNIAVSVAQRAIHPAKHTLNDVGLLRPHIWKARVGLSDLGIAPHINNASVAANMELARWHASGLSGLIQLGFTRKWSVLAGSNMIWYRREIPPFAPYEIHSQVVYWDDAWFFFRHRFACPVTGTFFIEGITRVIIKDSHRNTIGLAQVMDELGLDGTQKSPPMPDVVKGYLAWDAATKTAMESHQNEPQRQ